MKKQDKHFLNIKKIYPNVTSVVKPITVGLVHDVYIAESTDNKYICRFSDKNTAFHNLEISELLTSNDIPVPNVSIYDCGDYYCETYPFIPGKTLHERILEGLSGDKLDNIYNQMFNMSCKISNIKYGDITNISMPFISNLLRKTIAILNPSERKLCHTDLHAKNILLDEQDNVCAILDLDAINPEFISVSYFIMMKDAKYYGYDINRLEHLFTQKGIKHLNSQIKVINFATRMYHFVFPECARKQLLKIRVK